MQFKGIISAIKDIRLEINNFQMFCQVMITLQPKDRERLVVLQAQYLIMELKFNKMCMLRILQQELKKFFSHQYPNSK